MINYLPILIFIAYGKWLGSSSNLFTLTLVASSLTLFALKNIQKVKNFRINRIQILQIAIVGILILSTFKNKINLDFAVSGIFQRNTGLLHYLLLFLLIWSTSNGGTSLEKFTNISLPILVIFAVILGMLQVLGMDPTSIDEVVTVPGVKLTLGNPNFAAAFLGLLACVPIYYGLQTNKFYFKLISGFIFLLLVYIGTQTNSFQFYVLLASSCITFLIINNLERLQTLSRTKKFKIESISILGVSAVMLFVAVANIDKIILETNAESRLHTWKVGYQIFKSHALLGVGPDQYQFYAPQYQTIEQMNREGINFIADKAHNVYLDIFASGGLPAGGLWLLFVGLSLLKIWKIVEVNNVSPKSSQIALLSSIWVAYLVQLLFSPDQIQISTISFISLGTILFMEKDNYDNNNRNVSSTIVKITNISLVAILICTSLFFAQKTFSETRAWKILKASTLEVTEIKSFTEITNSEKLYEFMYLKLFNSNAECSLISPIIEKTIEKNNRNFQAHYAQAVCDTRSGDLDSALGHLEYAIKLYPLNPQIKSSYARVLLAKGEKKKAEIFIGQIEKTFPDYEELVGLKELVSETAQ